jgi:polyribonucleotide nucleotidyltransferase
VVGIKEFGCFVEVMPGKDGMVHISELANMRVNKVEDICKIGDEMVVKCIDVDDKGRVRLSRRAAMSDMDEGARQDSGGQSPSDSSQPPREGGEGHRDRGPRRDGPRHGDRRGR